MFLTGEEERMLVSGGDWEKAPEVRAMELRSTASPNEVTAVVIVSLILVLRRQDTLTPVLTILTTHGALSESSGFFPLFIAHRAHPPRFGLRGGLFDIDVDGVGVPLDLAHGVGAVEEAFGLLGHAAPVTRAGSLFGEGLVESRAGNYRREKGRIRGSVV